MKLSIKQRRAGKIKLQGYKQGSVLIYRTSCRVYKDVLISRVHHQPVGAAVAGRPADWTSAEGSRATKTHTSVHD